MFSRPVLFALKNQGFEVNLLLSTLSPDSDTQSDTTVVSRHVQSVRKKSASKCKSSSKRNNKSTNQTKKSTVLGNATIDSMFKRQSTKNTNQRNETPNRVENNVRATAGTNNPVNDVPKRNEAEPERSRLFTISPTSTPSSTTRKRIPESHKKLVNSVFSSITKRKSTTDNEDYCKEERDADLMDLDESIPRSPPCQQLAKRAKMVFQKCFQTTFDPRMLPGHNTILVEDSDENNSD